MTRHPQCPDCGTLLVKKSSRVRCPKCKTDALGHYSHKITGQPLLDLFADTFRQVNILIAAGALEMVNR